MLATDDHEPSALDSTTGFLDPDTWFAERGLIAIHTKYDTRAREYLAGSGHYLDAPPPQAYFAVGVERRVRGLIGDVGDGVLRGLCVVGRPIARNVAQDGSVGEVTRFVLAPELQGAAKDEPLYGIGSKLLVVAGDVARARGMAALIAYHDRTRHSGCIYRKAGFRKDRKSRVGTRRGTWASRPDRAGAAAAEVAPKQRWRLELREVEPARAGIPPRGFPDRRDESTPAPRP